MKSRNNNFIKAVEYYKNAKSRLREVKIVDGLYTKVKPVQEACGTCYLGVLYALNGYFLQYGIEEKNLPKSYEEYIKLLNRITVKNGKLIKMFKKAYQGLHVLGYYRGTTDVDNVKLWFSQARWIIEHLTGKKL